MAMKSDKVFAKVIELEDTEVKMKKLNEKLTRAYKRNRGLRLANQSLRLANQKLRLRVAELAVKV